MEADALSAVLNALAALSDHEPVSLRIAVVRAFRALCVAVADCAGPSLWGLGEEYLEYRSETRSTLDYVFQVRTYTSGFHMWLILVIGGGSGRVPALA